jgi:excisionase family DNA binding protein
MRKNESINDMPEIIDARDIAGYLNIGYTKALHFIRFSGISYMKIGNTYRVYKTAFLKWIQSEEPRIVKSK